MDLNSGKPKVIHSEIIDGRLKLTLDWFGLETSHSIITRTPKGFHYENVGLMRRELSCHDEIFKEIECDESVRSLIEKLPVKEIN